MKRNIFRSLALLQIPSIALTSILILNAVPSVQSIGATSQPDPVNWGTECAGCRLGVCKKSLNFSAGAEADVNVIIDNKGDGKVSFENPLSPDNEFAISAVDGNGDKVGLTAYGTLSQMVSDAKLESIPSGSSVEKKVRINRILDLSIPGKYRVTFKLACTVGAGEEKPKKLELQAPALDVDIIEP